MGYAVKPKVYRLTWDESHDQHGLEVAIEGMVLGEHLELLTLTTIADELATVVPKIQSWNLEDGKGQPLPVSVESLMKHGDRRLAVAIVRAYMQALTGVSGPKEKPSNDGDSEIVMSLPMAV